MEAHDRILHELLDVGEALLTSGAEINRVEDTMTRLGRAYGAQEVNIFVITSDIVLTLLFDDGTERTQTRRIRRAASPDFTRLEKLNALSRRVCAEPLAPGSLGEAVREIMSAEPTTLTSYLGNILTAGGFAVFLGGSWLDGLLAGAIGAVVCLLQRRVLPVFRNAMFFDLMIGLLSGSFICLVCRMTDIFSIEKLSIGVIMLMIPGANLTNSVRDMLVGHTISGLLRLAESLLLALMLALGFCGAFYWLGA